MLQLVFGTLYVCTSAGIVKKFRPNAFRGSDKAALATDIALTAAGAVTVAPVVVLAESVKQLAKVAVACVAVNR